MEDGRGGVSVEGLTEVEVSCFAEALALARARKRARKKAATKYAHSSRSHSVFSVATREPAAQPCGRRGGRGPDQTREAEPGGPGWLGERREERSRGARRYGAEPRGWRDQQEFADARPRRHRFGGQTGARPVPRLEAHAFVARRARGKSKTCILATVGMASAASEETVATAEYARARGACGVSPR